MASDPSKRENFTLLHELAHQLVYRCAELLDWAIDRPDKDHLIEEICDQMAAELLLPPEFVLKVVGQEKVRARHVAELYSRGQASREACTIAGAKLLGCTGFVTMIDRKTGRIALTSRVGDPRPYPWKGDTLPATHHIKSLRPGRPLTVGSWWMRADGSRRGYWLDAYSDPRDDGYAFAIFADVDQWGIPGVHILEETESRPVPSQRTFWCSGCKRMVKGWQFECSKCHQPPCPTCKRCGCDVADDNMRTCTKCNLRFIRQRVRNGVCDGCR
jgi:hypothetical protein